MLISIYMIAITAEAMSGALAAGRRNMDLFGVAVIAFLLPWAAVRSVTSSWATFLSPGPSTHAIST